MVKQLEKKIIEASMRYYKGQDLMMSDAQFDAALDELRKLDPNHYILNTTGWGYTDAEGKINHIGKHQVGSLDKVKYPEAHLIMNKKGIITPKLDGLSVVLNVYNGKITALTRNNGIVGKDCTNKMVYLLANKHPKFYESLCNIKGLFSVRGEVLTDPGSQDHFDKNGIISLRNYAAGVINRNEVTQDLHHVLFVPYFIRIDSNTTYSNNKQMIDKLEEMGSFPIPHEEFESLTPDYLNRVYADWRGGFLIDGIVISTYSSFDDDGPDYTVNEQHSIAYKFEAESKEAIVDDVIWDTGSAGRIVPVAKLTSPIELSGAMVQNISCHHAGMVRDWGIGKGATVRISRANEVIPYLNEVIAKVEPAIPTQCPVCNGEVAWDGECYLVCTNPTCEAKSRSALLKMFEFCNIPEGLSVTTITKWLDQFPVNGGYSNVQDIATFVMLFRQVPNKDTATRRTILQHTFNDHYGMLLHKFENNLQAKFDAGLTPSEFWYMLNLRGIGGGSAEKLGNVNPKTIQKDQIQAQLSSINGVTYLVPKILIETYDAWKKLAGLFTIVEAEQEVKESNKFENVVFCMTGFRDEPLRDKLVANGATEKGGVVKGVTLLIAKDPSSSSGKAKEARDRGVEIISKDEAYKRFM